MRIIETIGYQGGIKFIAADKIVAFQHRKNAGDMTELGITGRPQTTVWVACGWSTEDWIILEHVDDFKRKFLECATATHKEGGE